MSKPPQCPVFETVKLIGDKWSLLIIRDIMFHDKRHFGELLNSKEGIAKNILSNRLKKLVENAVIVKAPDYTHKQKNKYTLSYKGIQLIPLLIEFFQFDLSMENLSEKNLELYVQIRDNRVDFQENLENELTREIDFVFKNNPILQKETIRREFPNIKIY